MIPLITDNPYHSFALTAHLFYPSKKISQGIHPKSHIERNVKYDETVQIGPGAVISSDVHIGSNCRIGANTVILKDVPENGTMVGNPARNINKDKKSDENFKPYGVDVKGINQD